MWARIRIPTQAVMSKRDSNWVEGELRILIEFVRENRAQLFGNNYKGKRAPANVEKIKKSCWQRAVSVLKESGGKHREWSKVRKRWGELAAKARKYRRNAEKTGKFKSV